MRNNIMPVWKNLDYKNAQKTMEAWNQHFTQFRPKIGDPNKDPYASALLGELPPGYK